MKIQSLAVSEMRQFCQNQSRSAAAILNSKYNDSCYIYNIMSCLFYGREDMQVEPKTKILSQTVSKI